MSDFFIWNFRGKLISVDAETFSCEWLCRTEDAGRNLNRMCGKTIWLILVNNGASYLFGHMVAEKIESVKSGRYIITADDRASFRLLPRDKDDWADWKIPRDAGMGIFPASNTHAEQICALLNSNIKIRRRTETPHKIPVFRPEEVEINYREILSSRCYGDLAWTVGRKITPYAEALSLGDCKNKKNAESLLRELDFNIMHILKNGLAPPWRPRKTVSVDALLRPANADNMVPRQFTAGVKNNPFSIDKTQAAEEAHQAIVRDLCRFLAARNIQPMFSRSIDAAAHAFGQLFIFEVKSANSDNFEEQARKGIMQILEYRMWINRGGKLSVPVLVISSILSPNREAYVERLAASAGVAAVFYHQRARDKFAGLGKLLRIK